MVQIRIEADQETVINVTTIVVSLITNLRIEKWIKKLSEKSFVKMAIKVDNLLIYLL